MGVGASARSGNLIAEMQLAKKALRYLSPRSWSLGRLTTDLNSILVAKLAIMGARSPAFAVASHYSSELSESVFHERGASFGPLLQGIVWSSLAMRCRRRSCGGGKAIQRLSVGTGALIPSFYFDPLHPGRWAGNLLIR